MPATCQHAACKAGITPLPRSLAQHFCIVPWFKLNSHENRGSPDSEHSASWLTSRWKPGRLPAATLAAPSRAVAAGDAPPCATMSCSAASPCSAPALAALPRGAPAGAAPLAGLPGAGVCRKSNTSGSASMPPAKSDCAALPGPATVPEGCACTTAAAPATAPATAGVTSPSKTSLAAVMGVAGMPLPTCWLEEACSCRARQQRWRLSGSNRH